MFLLVPNLVVVLWDRPLIEVDPLDVIWIVLHRVDHGQKLVLKHQGLRSQSIAIVLDAQSLHTLGEEGIVHAKC